MLININHYMRLRHIAFFIPNVLENKRTKYSIPIPQLIPIDDEKLKKVFFREITSVLSINRDSKINTAVQYMQIDDFEVKLFLVSVSIYMNLSALFSPYEIDFKSRKKLKTVGKYSFEDDSEGFYKSIPSDAISKDMVKKKSYGMFSSVRKACYFYCKFTPSYLLYAFSVTIKTHKSEIPELIYLRDELANYLCCFPVESFALLNERLSDLQELLETYFKCGDAFKKLKKRERSFWIKYLKIMREGLFLKFIGISKELSAESPIPVLKRLFHKKYAPLQKEEKQRRKRISKSQNKRLSQRQEKVQKHIEIIRSNVFAKKISVKAACEEYFKTKKDDLKKINITSARTLQNLCSHTKPDKQRTNFVNRSYLSPTYSKYFQDTIEMIYNKIDFSSINS